jgi:DNA-binding MarR family transcriptional regulator
MKGFFIEVTNNLLDGKHVKSMGMAIWEFMWCLDKMTKIDEDGTGWVLGGKPVKWKEVKKDLTLDEGTISENMQKLQKEGYITLKRTPYGNIISVHKAKKRYGKVAMSSHGNNAISPPENAISGYGKVAMNKEDSISIDNTVDKITVATSATGNLVPLNEVISLFKGVNPTYERLFKRPPERAALERLIAKFGVEKIQNLLKELPGIISKKYAPRITTPLELERDLGKLVAFVRQEQSGKVNKVHLIT